MTYNPQNLIVRPEIMPDLSKFDPDSHDLVSELLLGMRLKGVQYRRIHVAPPFGLRFQNPPECGVFYFVARGSMLLRDGSNAGGGALMALKAGDAVLMPRGGEHALLSAPGVSCTSLADLDATRICESIAAINAMHGGRLEKGEISDDVLIFCGCMELDLGGMQPLVASMPGIMHVGTLLDRYPELRAMLDAMERESCSERAGYAAVLARLADVVAAFIVRGWVECGCGDAAGWVQALRDPRLGRALVALHREPGRNWTVAELAAEAGNSRSVFAERFLAATGMTPLRYLTELRMRLAAQWIARDREPIEAVSYRLGYGSLAAFSRAFKRTIGQPPGALRAQGESLSG
nr:AraC family transcriptional regulator [Burkholderia gladioli]